MADRQESSALLSQEEAGSLVLTYAFSGALGDAGGKSVTYSHLRTSETTSSWIASLENDLDDDFMYGDQPVDRFLVNLDRAARRVVSHDAISISKPDLDDCVFQATRQHVKAFSRSADGSLSISYKVTVVENADVAYIVQLRFHADVTSMNLLMGAISSTANPLALPLPRVFTIPDEAEKQAVTGFGRQVAQFVEGRLASSVYADMPHEGRLRFVQNMARAYQALWDIPMPGNPHRPLIGELRARKADHGSTVLYVGPDRHYSLGGPFDSTRDWLRARIRASLRELEKQEGVDEYKERYLSRIKAFIEAGMPHVPDIIEEVPVVAVHSDMAPHNVIIGSDGSPDIRAVIDWEFVACAPFAAAYNLIEMLFREFDGSGHGPEYPRANELRSAFWKAIPRWKAIYEQKSTLAFLEWYRFALFLKAESPPEDCGAEAKEAFWAENVKVVEGMLRNWISGA